MNQAGENVVKAVCRSFRSVTGAAGVALLLLWLPVVLGCGGTSSSRPTQPLTYEFASSTRVCQQTFSGILQASQSFDLSLKEGVWGVIKWMKDEGTLVASGEKLVVIDMENYETRLRDQEASLRHYRENRDRFDAVNPYELRKSRDESVRKALNLELKKNEQGWLFQRVPANELERTRIDLERATLEEEHAKALLEFQQNVTARGFDTPFSRRRTELEAMAKSIERDYSRRRLESLKRGPLPEELERSGFQLNVASGELWLARESEITASGSRDIARKTLDFQQETFVSQVRQTRERLKQSEISAPYPGMVIHPVIYDGKATPGDQIWEGLVFMKVVGTAGYILDAAVDENISSNLKIGMPATVSFDAFPTQRFSGTVTFVGKMPRRFMSRTRSDFKKFPVQVGVDVGTLPVKLGQKAMIGAVSLRQQGVFLPRDVVRGEGASATVLLWESSSFVERPVTIEPFDGDFVRWLNPPQEKGLVQFPP
jgi:multidrug resistance efflux pump